MEQRRNDYEQSIVTGVRVRYTGTTPAERDKDLERALGQFKKIINREGILIELKERESFKSEGRKNYEQRKKAIYRINLKKEKRKHPYKRQSANDKDYRPNHDKREKRPYR